MAGDSSAYRHLIVGLVLVCRLQLGLASKGAAAAASEAAVVAVSSAEELGTALASWDGVVENCSLVIEIEVRACMGWRCSRVAKERAELAEISCPLVPFALFSPARNDCGGCCCGGRRVNERHRQRVSGSTHGRVCYSHNQWCRQGDDDDRSEGRERERESTGACRTPIDELVGWLVD